MGLRTGIYVESVNLFVSGSGKTMLDGHFCYFMTALWRAVNRGNGKMNVYSARSAVAALESAPRNCCDAKEVKISRHLMTAVLPPFKNISKFLQRTYTYDPLTRLPVSVRMWRHVNVGVGAVTAWEKIMGTAAAHWPTATGCNPQQIAANSPESEEDVTRRELCFSFASTTEAKRAREDRKAEVLNKKHEQAEAKRATEVAATTARHAISDMHHCNAMYENLEMGWKWPCCTASFCTAAQLEEHQSAGVHYMTSSHEQRKPKKTSADSRFPIGLHVEDIMLLLIKECQTEHNVVSLGRRAVESAARPPAELYNNNPVVDGMNLPKRLVPSGYAAKMSKCCGLKINWSQ